MGILYRANQFLHALTAQPSAQELASIDHILPPKLADLFRRMPHADQSHCLRVHATLLHQGETNSDLLTAALLHDVGKSHTPLKPWDRTIVVLTRKFFPDYLERWGTGELHGWKKPFIVHSHHAEWGAQMVTELGGSEDTVYLIRHHQDILTSDPVDPKDRLLISLQTADSMN